MDKLEVINMISTSIYLENKSYKQYQLYNNNNKYIINNKKEGNCNEIFN